MSRWLAALILSACIMSPALAYQEIAVSGGGAISGKVKISGPVPAAKKIATSKDQEVCGKEKTAPDVLATKDGGLQNAVVRIVNIDKGKKMALPKQALDQKACEYTPHVVLVPKGAPLDILNSDGILHNVHTFAAKNPSFNKAMPKFKKQMTVEGSNFAEAETIEVRCDAHEWMHGWLQVVEHPYYAVTDPSGSFALPDVPPGKYSVEVWHEKLGKAIKEVTVDGGKTVMADFSLGKK
ncbi:MAG: carboxypeptidase regulatory-like domain-containing protein [Nitrospirae bacterium]|nr:carboxypeptidase regulatory-like domain-containing protein [Nitrospirota bacterium]